MRVVMTQASGATERLARPRALPTFARDVSLALVGSALSMFLGLVLALVVTRGLGAHGAGVFFVSMGVFAIVNHVAVFGADIGAMRTISRLRALRRDGDLRWTVLAAVVPVAVLSIVLALFMERFAPEIADFAARGDGNADLASSLEVLALFLPAAAIAGVLIAATRGFGTMLPYFSLEQIGLPLLRPILVGAAIAFGAGSVFGMLAWASAFAPALAGGAVWILVLLRRVEQPHAAAPTSVAVIARDFWRFSSVRGVASVCQVVIAWFDVILVAALSSVAEAGVYAAITRLVKVGALVQRATIVAMGPQMSALLAVDDHLQASILYRTSTVWLVTFSFPVYLVLATSSATVVQIFGQDFATGATALTILCLAMLVNMATGPVTTILLMAGKAGLNLVDTLGSLIINVSLNLLLIPWLGITGAAIAWSASIIFQNLLPLVQIARGLGLHPLSNTLALVMGVATCCFATAGVVATLVWPGSLPALALLVAAASAAYGMFIWRSRKRLALDEVGRAVRIRERASAPALNAS